MALRLAYRLIWVTLVVALVGCGRAAEESLRASEQQFKLLVQGVTDYAIYLLTLKQLAGLPREGEGGVVG